MKGFETDAEYQAAVARNEGYALGQSQAKTEMIGVTKERDVLLHRVAEREHEIMALESTLNDTIESAKRLQDENNKLKRIIDKELSENDELGCEFTYIVLLKARLRAIIEYCKPHQDLMWAKYITGIAKCKDDWRDDDAG